MQVSSPLPVWERLWRSALALASELTDGMIWQGMLRANRQPEDVRRHASILVMLKGFDQLFFHELAQYPEWLQDPGMRRHVCSWVTEARRIDDETVALTLNGRAYTFHLGSRPCAASDGEALHHHGTLQLLLEGKEVLRLKLMQDEEGLDFDWHEVDIDTFVDGDWIAELRGLNRQILAEGCGKDLKTQDASAAALR